MSNKSIESKYYLELIAVDSSEYTFVSKIKARFSKTVKQFSFISKGQWLLLLAMYGICLLFMTFACICIA